MTMSKRGQTDGLPLPNLKYGLGISFDAQKIAWPAVSGKRGTGAAPRLTATNCRVYDLSELHRGPLARRARQLLAWLPAATDRVAAWHQAAATGAVVAVGEGVKDAVVDVEAVVGTADSASDLLVIAGADSRVTIVEHDYSGPRVDRSFRSGRVLIQADSHAHVTHVRLQDLKQGATERHQLRAEAAEGARVDCLEAVFGADYAQSDVAVALVGEGAQAAIKTIFFGSGGHQFDLLAGIEHRASATSSSIDVRGALSGNARAVSRGLIRVNRGTLACDGRQDLRGLLLSEEARMDAMPKLEIDSADVRCGHGAAVGRLDKEALFYLTSRGLEPALAKKMLAEGFFAKAIEAMRGSGLEQTASCIISERLDKATGHERL